ncbi:DUF6894 family protein [Marinibacterium profundimaris]|uniref:DUF6894 domain-containing protein n=1 Tax=Marinibacterium profundimaris TaxID=1679460 RepID=A0A225NQW0_9RHOB|nr:hypothetical protein [Marinibacterium profundimaris]OWU73587.1 hypothetical protein ATO3_13125 [Marinibacterium profundimaris]
MTLFYFDIKTGEDYYDEVGTDLANRAEARQEALAVLAPIAGEQMPADANYSVCVTVRDQNKRPIFHASLSVVEDWIE